MLEVLDLELKFRGLGRDWDALAIRAWRMLMVWGVECKLPSSKRDRGDAGKVGIRALGSAGFGVVRVLRV